MLVRQILPLLVAYANEGEPVVGRTRFQKMIFIMQNEAKFKENYSFIAHDYGPYSPELQSDIDDLIVSGLLRENRDTIDQGKIRYQYMITPAGASVLTKIITDSQLNKKFKFNKAFQLATAVKSELNHMDLSVLLSDIYAKYPHFARYSRYRF